MGGIRVFLIREKQNIPGCWCFDLLKKLFAMIRRLSFSFHTLIWLYSKSLESLLAIEKNIIWAPNNFDQWHWSKYLNIWTPAKPSAPFPIQHSNFHSLFFFFFGQISVRLYDCHLIFSVNIKSITGIQTGSIRKSENGHLLSVKWIRSFYSQQREIDRNLFLQKYFLVSFEVNMMTYNVISRCFQLLLSKNPCDLCLRWIYIFLL